MGKFQLFKKSAGNGPQMNNNSSMNTKTSMYASKTSMYKPMQVSDNGKPKTEAERYAALDEKGFREQAAKDAVSSSSEGLSAINKELDNVNTKIEKLTKNKRSVPAELQASKAKLEKQQKSARTQLNRAQKALYNNPKVKEAAKVGEGQILTNIDRNVTNPGTITSTKGPVVTSAQKTLDKMGMGPTGSEASQLFAYNSKPTIETEFNMQQSLINDPYKLDYEKKEDALKIKR